MESILKVLEEKASVDRDCVVVLDVDDTLWEGDCDGTYGPPFAFESPGALRDCRPFKLFPEVVDIITAVEMLAKKSKGEKTVRLAVASRTMMPPWCREALNLFCTKAGTPFSKLIGCMEMYESRKTRHLKAIREKMSVKSWSDMIFFDNEGRNISDTRTLGYEAEGDQRIQTEIKKGKYWDAETVVSDGREFVTVVHTPDGLNFRTFLAGLEVWARRQEERELHSAGVGPGDAERAVAVSGLRKQSNGNITQGEKAKEAKGKSNDKQKQGRRLSKETSAAAVDEAKGA